MGKLGSYKLFKAIGVHGFHTLLALPLRLYCECLNTILPNINRNNGFDGWTLDIMMNFLQATIVQSRKEIKLVINRACSYKTPGIIIASATSERFLRNSISMVKD